MDIIIVRDAVSRKELKRIAKDQFGDFVKAVVDVEQGIMAIGGELHADEETTLSEQGSERKDMWGINIYPERSGEDWIVFNSMVNIKPQYDNRSRDITDAAIKEKIRAVVNRLVAR